MQCQNETELFADGSREIIFQVTRKYLEQLGITGTELVFVPQLHERVQNDGTKFQEFTQAVAILQGQSSKRPVSERLKDVIRLAEGAMKLVQEAATPESAEPPTVASLETLIRSDPALGPIRAGAALGKALRGGTQWREKWPICLDLLAATEDPALIVLLDQTLGEMLRLKSASDSLFRVETDNAAVLRGCFALLGDPEPAEKLDPASEIQPWIVALKGKAPLPKIALGVKTKLKEILAGSKPLADDDPKHEWETIDSLRERIAALPPLADDPDLPGLLARRVNGLTGPSKLNALLGTEKFVGPKLLILMKLLNEVDDANLKSNVLRTVSHYFELPNLKRDFGGPTSSDVISVLTEVRAALTMSTGISQYRKTRFEELLDRQFAGNAKDKRRHDRTIAGPEDMVVINGVKAKLRNWSPQGLLFGPWTGELKMGQKFTVTVLVRNSILTINFEADAKVVRLAEDVVAVHYKFRDRQAEKKVKSYFG